MKTLQKLTPAEAHLVLKGEHASIRDLLKHTTMDLLLKNVLKIEKSFHQPHERDPYQEYTYVTHGDSFSKYKPLPHEALIMKPFIKNSSFFLLFRTFVKLAYENSGRIGQYHYVIRKSPKIADFFMGGFFFDLFKSIYINSRGSNLRENLKNEIAALDKALPNLIENDKPKVYQIIDAIKGNVFLLKNFDLTLLKEYNESLFDEMTLQEKHDGTSTSGCGGCFSSYSDSFDSSCGGDSGCSGDSGCGGDGGCSGCGGCGGGCGGD